MIYHGTITMKNGAELPFELYPEDTPRIVENFARLVEEGCCDGKTFHRIIENFVSQDGCSYGTGAGGLGYTIPCETANNPHKHEDGSLSMTHRGKDTSCCQFLICHCPQPYLDGIHIIFGKVTSNLGAVRDMCNGDVIRRVVIEEIQNR